jgi:hypothetical protein
MLWFKITLMVFLGLSGLASLIDVGKGKYIKTNNPLISAISAILMILFVIGILIWL